MPSSFGKNRLSALPYHDFRFPDHVDDSRNDASITAMTIATDIMTSFSFRDNTIATTADNALLPDRHLLPIELNAAYRRDMPNLASSENGFQPKENMQGWSSKSITPPRLSFRLDPPLMLQFA